MATRNHLNEIFQKKERSEFQHGFEAISRLGVLQKMLLDVDPFDPNLNETLKYYPIGCVACAESFFRSACTYLIDENDTFRENTKNTKDDRLKRVDLELFLATLSKKVTFGEIISHVLTFNSFESINSSLSLVIGGDFMDCLNKFDYKKLPDPIIIHDRKELFESYHSKKSVVLESVKRIFLLRNIYCHEHGNHTNLDYSILIDLFEDFNLFIQVSDIYINDLIYPNYPDFWENAVRYDNDLISNIEDRILNKVRLIASILDKENEQVTTDLKMIEVYENGKRFLLDLLSHRHKTWIMADGWKQQTITREFLKLLPILEDLIDSQYGYIIEQAQNSTTAPTPHTPVPGPTPPN